MGLDDSTGGERQTYIFLNGPQSFRCILLLLMKLLVTNESGSTELLWDTTDFTFLVKMHCVHFVVHVNNKVARPNNTHTQGNTWLPWVGFNPITLCSLSTYDSGVLHCFADQREEKKRRAQYLKEAGLGEREEQKHLNKDNFQIVKLISNGAYR